MEKLFWAAVNKTSCVVSTQHLFSPNCIKHVLSGHHEFLFLVELGWNESKRSMMECIWVAKTLVPMQRVGSVVFFTHLSLSLYYLCIFFNNPHKEMLGDSVPLLSVDETLETTVG